MKKHKTTKENEVKIYKEALKGLSIAEISSRVNIDRRIIKRDYIDHLIKGESDRAANLLDKANKIAFDDESPSMIKYLLPRAAEKFRVQTEEGKIIKQLLIELQKRPQIENNIQELNITVNKSDGSEPLTIDQYRGEQLEDLEID